MRSPGRRLHILATILAPLALTTACKKLPYPGTGAAAVGASGAIGDSSQLVLGCPAGTAGNTAASTVTQLIPLELNSYCTNVPSPGMPPAMGTGAANPRYSLAGIPAGPVQITPDCLRNIITVQSGRSTQVFSTAIRSDGTFAIGNVPVPVTIANDLAGNANCAATLSLSITGVATCTAAPAPGSAQLPRNALVQLYLNWSVGTTQPGGITTTTPPLTPPSILPLPIPSASPSAANSTQPACTLYNQCQSTQTATISCGR